MATHYFLSRLKTNLVLLLEVLMTLQASPSLLILVMLKQPQSAVHKSTVHKPAVDCLYVFIHQRCFVRQFVR